MTVERIKELLEVTPFQPFTIHLADGRAVPVRHRELVIMAPSGRTLIVVQPDDRMNIIDLILVTDLELDLSSDSKTRGKGRRSAS